MRPSGLSRRESWAIVPVTERPSAMRRTSTNRPDQNGRQVSFLKGLFSSGGLAPQRPFPPLGFDSPSVEVSGVRLSSINLKGAEMEIDLEMNNPNTMTLNLISVAVLLESEGRNIVMAKNDREMSIRPHLTETLKIPLTISYRSIQDVYPEIKPGQVMPYTMKLSPSFQEALRVSRTSAEKSGELPIPLEPNIHIKKVRIDAISMDQSSILLQLKVENKNLFDLTVVKMEYDASLSGSKIVKGGATPSGAVVKSNGSKLVDLPIAFWPMQFGAALWSIIRGRGSEFGIEWKLEADTPYGLMHL
ncbi:hypothetical protein O6H91_15G044200 [Diphasiastrum complanatum]|uniref:Uncharacterized protein n=1 Tax=Diphasiastrum complanatum TaxID=34168 RepID=A0ACC2BHT7_DIPCM|nr:hypothetical protein O6H91_Y538600 [Diphasiastrum complanatum]KAJ7297591.1 hypothetical protein O6H91_Y046600 [Diphasiastrum complanatum]KAJ7529315.1 hypothetical protein O6H91_15G044200 [Diphasiastrum complanatum]